MSKSDKALQERLRKDPLLASDIAKTIIYCTGQRGGIQRDIRDDVYEWMDEHEAPDPEIVRHCEVLEAAGWIVEVGHCPCPKCRPNGKPHPAMIREYDLTPKAKRAYPLIDYDDRKRCSVEEWRRRREAAYATYRTGKRLSS